MARFDFTSFLATISFFLSVALFITEVLAFFEFLKFLLILEGVVFLSGAFSNGENDSKSGNTIKNLRFNYPARFNQIRYIFGLVFFFVGSFIEKLQY